MKPDPCQTPVAAILAPIAAVPAGRRADLLCVRNAAGPDIQRPYTPPREETRRVPVLREPHRLELSPARSARVVEGVSLAGQPGRQAFSAPDR